MKKTFPITVPRINDTVGILSLFGLLAYGVSSASATEWKYQSGSPPANQGWNNAANWTSGVPSGGFFIRNITGGLFPIIDGNLAATANGNSFIGAYSAPNSRLDIRSGSLSVTNGWLLVGPDNPSSGILNLANTATADGTNLTGYALGSGSVSVTGVTTLARRNNSSGTLNINTTGSFSGNNAQILVGGGGTGTVNLVNGSFNTSHFDAGLVLGGSSDQNDANGTGIFNMSGGTMGNGTQDTGFQRFIRVGRQGTGVFNQTGGTVNIGNNLEIGVNSGSSGTVNLSGGTTSLDIMRVGMSGGGTLNISGEAAVTGRNFNDALTIGVNAGGAGTVNLDGGSLTLRSVKGGAGTSSFNFNGGTLVFTSFFADAFQGLAEANIHAGGAFIDTNGNDVGIAQDLQGDGDLTKLGSGKLTLTGVNISTGGLYVEAGTLSIASAFIDPAATVSIASDAFLDLDFDGDNVIGALVLGGIAMEAGTYDASSPFLTGSGTLTIIPEASGPAMFGLLLSASLLRRRRP
jgi:autotransporter-associated beta strand protein/T5SS/PEP-CTERM-associated repeat protein